MVLALEMGVTKLKAKNYYQLLANLVSGQYQTNEPQLIKCLQKVYNLTLCFLSFEVENVPYEQNFWVDLLSNLATSKVAGFNRKVIRKTLTSPNIMGEEAHSIELIPESSWISSILYYL